MMNKPLTDKEKQFTILPNEVDPKKSFAKAHQAISRALSDIKTSRKSKSKSKTIIK